MSAQMQETIKSILAVGKGILAADESSPTIKKRFDQNGIADNEHNHWIYRNLLFTTPGIEKYISGVIMFDETIRSKSANGQPFAQYLLDRGIMPGIKVDEGTSELVNFPGEKITKGLDTLDGRLKEYADMGARFTKWRAVIAIGDGIPTQTCIDANAYRLAEYAALAQSHDLVPIVEPEVLMDGDHGIDECETVTSIVLDSVFSHLIKQKVDLKNILLKPNMVISGKDAKTQANASQISDSTLKVFLKSVPKDVPGIVFLSGGQTAQEATSNLCTLNKDNSHPWVLSFSYGRALQSEALKVWAGKDENIEAAQKVFLEVAKKDSEATKGIC